MVSLPLPLLRCIILWVASLWLIAPLPSLAHEGHDHGAPPPVLNIPLAPRFAVEGESMEVVGVLQGAILRLYVDNFADNAPITGAKVEIESESKAWQGVAVESSPGVYDFSLPEFANVQQASLAPGNYPLTLTISHGEQFDLLAATLRVPDSAATGNNAQGKVQGNTQGNPQGKIIFFGGLLFAAGFGLILFLRKKNKNKHLLNLTTNQS